MTLEKLATEIKSVAFFVYSIKVDFDSLMNNLQLAYTTTDPAILDELSRNEDYVIRWWVASNYNTSQKTLKQMYIVEEEDCVKYYIEINPNFQKES